MTKKPKPGPNSSRTQRKPTTSGGIRAPVRISIDREALATVDKRAIAAQVGVGVVAGWLASWIVGGSGLLHYVITGLAGSLIGGFLLERLGIDLEMRSPLAHRITTATIGAMVIVILARLVG